MNALPAYPATLYVNGSAAGQALRDTVLSVWVSKGYWATVEAVSGAAPSPEGAVLIPYGLPAPPFYSFREVADCTGERAFAKVQLHKQYCLLSMSFTGPPGWGSPLSVALRGNVNGFSLAEDRPLEGAFYCRLDGALSCRIPRLRPGDPLWLDIVLKDSVLRSFPLGAYLEAAGYDWTAPDLADRALEVDVSVTALTFRMDRWSCVEYREIIL